MTHQVEARRVDKYIQPVYPFEMTTQAKYPSQIKYIVGNEAAERFSFYGMRAILFVFMTDTLMMQKSEAGATYHLFVSAAYLLPLFGAWISDRFLGKYKTIILLSIVYCLGHATLAVWDNQQGMYIALALIAIGAGGIKPCVSAHVGDQFNKSNQSLLSKVFSLFYFSINFGAFFSTLLTPVLLKNYGPSVAFGVPGVLMALATVIFWMGRKQYVHVPPTGKTGQAGFMSIFLYALTHQSQKKAGKGFWSAALGRFTPAEVEGAVAASQIFKLFIFVSVFWALFDQQGSSWVEQAKQMDLGFMGWELQASQIQALNPIMVMALIPLFSYVIYPLIGRMGYEMTSLRRMVAGMLMAAFSFVIVAIMQVMLDGGTHLSVAWQFIPYLVITMSEVMVSISGLEFAYTQAPRAMKSTIMSFWLLTVFVGNLFTAWIMAINKFSGAGSFWFFAAMMFGVALIFTWAASRYKVRNYIESDLPIGDPSDAPSGMTPAPAAT